MRRVVSRFLWVLALQAVATGGCNEVTVSDTAPLKLDILSLDEPSGDPVPLKGARLCQTDTTNCDTTNETGAATIQLPINEETSFTLVAENHVSNLVAVVMPVAENDLLMRTNNYMEAQFGRLMIDDPMVDTGAILATRYVYAEGATFESESAEAVPFYAAEDGWWSLDLTETTNSGRGGFVEVPPSDRHTIRSGGTALDCSAGWGWPGEDKDSYRVPVQPNYLTLLLLYCRP